MNSKNFYNDAFDMLLQFISYDDGISAAPLYMITEATSVLLDVNFVLNCFKNVGINKNILFAGVAHTNNIAELLLKKSGFELVFFEGVDYKKITEDLSNSQNIILNQKPNYPDPLDPRFFDLIK